MSYVDYFTTAASNLSPLAADYFNSTLAPIYGNIGTALRDFGQTAINDFGQTALDTASNSAINAVGYVPSFNGQFTNDYFNSRFAPTFGNSFIQKNADAIAQGAASGANQGFDWSKYFGNGQAMDNLFKPIAVGGNLWSAYNQQRMANKQHKLQKDSYLYNKALSEEERRRRAQADTNFNTGFVGTGA